MLFCASFCAVKLSLADCMQKEGHQHVHLEVAWELNGVPSRVIKDSILRSKDLLILDVGDVVEVMSPVKHVLAVRVHVPVPQVCGCVRVHITVGDEPHVGVARPDGRKECNVVLNIPRLATILHV